MRSRIPNLSNQQHAGSLNDPFRLTPHTWWQSENVHQEPVSPVTIGIVRQTHIMPSFSRRVDLDDSRPSLPPADGITRDIWSQDLNVILKNGPSEAIFTPRRTLCRIRIHPLSNTPFPQSHRIVMSMPLDNVLELWQFSCDPFSFRTLVNEHEWDLPGRDSEIVFEDFGGFLMRRIEDCVGNEARFTATVTIDSGCNDACLSFEEIVHGYRTVSLLKLNFRPVPWDHVVKDIKQEYHRLKEIQSAIKSALVEALEVTARQAPQVMLNVVENERGRGLVTWSQEDVTPGTAVYAHTIPISVKLGNDEKEDLKLTFTMFSNGMDSSTTTYYKLCVTSPSDIMFKFESGEISHQAFFEITRRLQVAGHTPSTHKYSRTEILGFHPQDGIAGGVVGVLGGDFLAGVATEPQRYTAEIRLDAIAITSSPIHYDPKTRQSPTRPTTSFPKRKRQAKLVFYEHVLFKTQEMMSIKLEETDPATLADSVGRKFALIADDIRTSRSRIMALLEASKPRRDPSLHASLLDLVGVWMSSSGLSASNAPLVIPRPVSPSRLPILTEQKEIRMPIWMRHGGRSSRSASPTRSQSPTRASSPTARARSPSRLAIPVARAVSPSRASSPTTTSRVYQEPLIRLLPNRPASSIGLSRPTIQSEVKNEKVKGWLSPSQISRGAWSEPHRMR
ncbi:hypothetical protein SmJEL517_g04558 [Synchytrium microbalum]|uniref:Uncharacterized protein n=1 Tax=Synchytrium microbalum TaxID=1806994 RepID=A0A507BZL4_9FUNG|nr:uncharacterized protein SmJEL517_g04558 [Synchytrium microbalum]TPX32299.1 hypothetical protein SmJEL517_g04558 [Synchytrium microbalum]